MQRKVGQGGVALGDEILKLLAVSVLIIPIDVQQLNVQALEIRKLDLCQQLIMLGSGYQVLYQLQVLDAAQDSSPLVAAPGAPCQDSAD